MDLEHTAAELLRVIRGKRSQTAFSRRLGYRCNVAYTWESRRRFPTAAKTLWACERVGIDVDYALQTFYRGRPDWLDKHDPTGPGATAVLLSDLRGGTSISDLAERSGRSRHAVGRWLRAEAEPRLPDFLRMIEATSLRLLDFLAAFVDPNDLPSVRERWQQLESARTLTHSAPWAPAILLGLQLQGYQDLREHQVGWLAARLGLDHQTETRCIELLAATGQIRMQRRKWVVQQIQNVDTRRGAGGTELKQFWAGVGLQRLEQGDRGLFSFNLFTVSSADLTRLEQLQRAHYRNMRQIIAASEPGEELVLANLQLVPLHARHGEV